VNTVGRKSDEVTVTGTKDNVGFGHLHIGREGQGVDIPKLSRRHRPQRHREVYAVVDGEGRGRFADAPVADRRVHVYVHQM